MNMEKMAKINEYYSAALKAQLEIMPKGFRKILVKKTGAQSSQITDIIHGRVSGSEERRRAIAHALGWEYEEFIRYGKSLITGEEYTLPQHDQALRIDGSHYVPIPRHNRLRLVGTPQGGVISTDSPIGGQPILINRDVLDDNFRLGAFKMLDDSMEPTIYKNWFVIVNFNDKEPEDDGIYLFLNNLDNGSYNVRRIKNDGEDVFLMKDKNCRPKLLRTPLRDVIAGRVVWVWLCELK